VSCCTSPQEFPNILYNLKVHYHVHKNPTLTPILCQINPVQTTPFYFSLHLNVILPHTFCVFLVASFVLAFQSEPLCIYILLREHYMPRPSHHPLLDPSNGYKRWSSSLCSFLQPPDTSSHFGLNIYLSTLFWNAFRSHYKSVKIVFHSVSLYTSVHLTERNISDESDTPLCILFI
jgi:hypothetical protein